MTKDEIEASIAKLQAELGAREEEEKRIGVERATRADECRTILGLIANGWVETKHDVEEVISRRVRDLLKDRTDG